MNYVILSHAGWEAFPYKRLLELLPEREEVCFAGAVSEEDERKHRIRSCPISRFASLETDAVTVLVASPYWIQTVLQWKPRRIIALLERCPADEDPRQWEKYNGLLAGCADLIVTASEKIYLEQCLRNVKTILLNGDSPLTYGVAEISENETLLLQDYESLFASAARDMLRGSSFQSRVRKQWEIRERHYRLLNEQIRNHETISYILASYLYLLNDASAGQVLTDSFEQAVLQETADCLHSHYRFFSALEAKNGNLEKAVHIYEITAFSEDERKRVQWLKSRLERGDEPLVKAELFRVNEDYRSAIQLLQEMNSAESKPLLLRNYVQTYRWEEALLLSDSIALSADDRISLEVLSGTVHLVHNRRHLAVRSYLRASMRKWDVLSNIADMLQLDRLASRVKERILGHE